MGSKITGRASIFGIPGTVSWTGSGTFFKKSASFSKPYELTKLMDDENDVASLAHSAEVTEGTLLFTPVAASGTNTAANAKESLPAPAKGSVVTLAGFNDAASSASFINKSDWVYTGGWKLEFVSNGFATYSLNIMRSDVYNLSTQPS